MQLITIVETDYKFREMAETIQTKFHNERIQYFLFQKYEIEFGIQHIDDEQIKEKPSEVKKLN